MKNYTEESGDRYFLEVDVQYPEKLHDLHNDLPFLPYRMKIEKVEKTVANLHDETEYVIHIRNLEQTLNHELFLKNVHRLTKFNQNIWLNRYSDMNADLKKKSKTRFENDGEYEKT